TTISRPTALKTASADWLGPLAARLTGTPVSEPAAVPVAAAAVAPGPVPALLPPELPPAPDDPAEAPCPAAPWPPPPPPPPAAATPRGGGLAVPHHAVQRRAELVARRRVRSVLEQDVLPVVHGRVVTLVQRRLGWDRDVAGDVPVLQEPADHEVLGQR